MATNQFYKISCGILENFLDQDDLDMSKQEATLGIQMSNPEQPYQSSRQGPEWGGSGG